MPFAFVLKLTNIGVKCGNPRFYYLPMRQNGPAQVTFYDTLYFIYQGNLIMMWSLIYTVFMTMV